MLYWCSQSSRIKSLLTVPLLALLQGLGKPAHPTTVEYQVHKVTSISAMAEKPHQLGDFEGVGHFEAKLWVEGYVLRQYLWTVR